MFEALLQNHIGKDHGIVRILIDDKDSLDVMLTGKEGMVPEDIGELKIITKDAYSITTDGLNKIFSLIESIKNEISLTADLYREGKIAEGSQKTVNIMDSVKPMMDFINSVGMNYSLSFDDIMIEENVTLREKVESFLKSFEELIMAQEKKDYVEIADFLEYQFVDDMTDWGKVVHAIAKEIELVHSNKNN